MDPRFDAFCRLLAAPDPADLPRRAHHWTCAGRSDRMETLMPPILLRWLQRRILERSEELPQPARIGRRKRPVRCTVTAFRDRRTG